MSIQIGPLSLEHNVLLAPMSGVSDQPFRRLARRCGAALVMSEMIASQALIRESRKSMLMAARAADEEPVAVQIAGNEPEVMADAARLNEDRGARLIDINFGCPAKKVVNGYAGSALMREEGLAARILHAVVRAVSVPVTLKMRL
ncbi:MAG: tRNA-dihydrouridine synthase, partial [Alphaproteobacteria bacterium]